MIKLSKEQIIKLHSHLIAETGGIDGIRDANLLESAIAAPFQSFGGRDVFPSLQQASNSFVSALYAKSSSARP